MKRFMIGITLLLGISSMAHSAEPKFWVDEADKTVVIAFNPKLHVKLIKLAVDDENYGRLDVNLSYVSGDMLNQIQAVMKRYPDFKEQRVIIEKEGFLKYQIPLLNISREVEPTRGVEGPYVIDEIYLTKDQYFALRSELYRNKPLVIFTGELAGSVPLHRTTERKELDSSICTKILGSEKTVGSLISRVALLSEKYLGSSEFQYESTRTSLIQDIQENCFELVQRTRVNSFGQVLNLEIRAKDPGRKLVGQTLTKSHMREVFPLAYDLLQEGVE